MSRAVSVLLSAALVLTSSSAMAGGFPSFPGGDGPGFGRKSFSGPGPAFGGRDRWGPPAAYYGGRRGWGYPRDYYYDRGGDGDDVILGVLLGAIGLAAIAAASKDNDDDRSAEWSDPDRVVVAQQAPTAYAEPAYDPALGSVGCLQTREYTTKVNIGGKWVDAYGTACLQADGSWLQGPSRTVPQD